jgi:protocatechuate 3,4-dioxygenase beta subunit
MKRRALLLQGSTFLATVAFAGPEPILGGPCEGCELVYRDMPSKLASSARIAPLRTPGVPMVIDGTVRTRDGHHAAGVVVYAYHTDSAGIYPRAATRHGAFRGWTITDASGRYRFETIRPAAYPGRDIPEHVHMHVIERGKGTYWIDDLRFQDDPLINDRNRRNEGRGGDALAMPVKRGDTWHVRRDVTLGLNVSPELT